MKTKHQLLPLALLALTPVLSAQQLPGAGSQLRQLTPPPPPPISAPSIRIEEQTAATPPGTPSASLLVKQLRNTGAHDQQER